MDVPAREGWKRCNRDHFLSMLYPAYSHSLKLWLLKLKLTVGYFSQRLNFKARRNWFDNTIGPCHRANYAISPCKSNLLSNLHFVADLKHNFWKDRQLHFYFGWLYDGWLRASRGKDGLQRIILDHRSMKLTVWLPLIPGLANSARALQSCPAMGELAPCMGPARKA